MLRFTGEQPQQENHMLPILYPCVKSQTSLGLDVRYAGLCVIENDFLISLSKHAFGYSKEPSQ